MVPALRADDLSEALAVALAESTMLRCEDRTPFRLHNHNVDIVTTRSGDGLVYFGGGRHLHVSTDHGRSFRPVTTQHDLWIWDTALVPSEQGLSAVIAQEGSWFDPGRGLLQWDPPLARTDDGGRTWRPLPVDLPAFRKRGGAKAVGVTPTGRIIAIGGAGVICSEDDGVTWAHTCPTPDRS